MLVFPYSTFTTCISSMNNHCYLKQMDTEYKPATTNLAKREETQILVHTTQDF